MARKRAPGAGRKPKGAFAGKTATFTTRIQPETRTVLKPSKAEQRNRALARAVATLAENIERATGHSWKTDAFTGQALRDAIDAFLFHFAPTTSDSPTVPAPVEEMATKMPPEFAAAYRTPAGLGRLIAFSAIHEIESAMRLPDDSTAPINLHVPVEVVQQLGRDLGPDKGGKR
jgi:hypothetical protein